MANQYTILAQKLQKKIIDDNVKIALFNVDYIDHEDDISGMGVITKMLSLTFAYALSRWKYRVAKKEKLSTSANAKRVYDAFGAVYHGEDVGIDMIVYVLTEMQLDVVQLYGRSDFCDVFSPEGHASIQKFREPVKMWLQSAKRSEQNKGVLYDMLNQLVSSIVLFDRLALTFPEAESGVDVDDVQFVVDKVVVPSQGILRIREGSYYLLQDISQGTNHSCKMEYASLDFLGKMELFKQFRELDSTLISKTVAGANTIFAKSLMSVGIRYIKNLALAVCDAIEKNTKERIYVRFYSTYSDIFEKELSQDCKWDNVITILMIEIGPTALLEFILDTEGIYFIRILDNLQIRYSSATFKNDVVEAYEAELSVEKEMVKKCINDEGSIVKSINYISNILMAKHIIDGLSKLEKSNGKSRSLFVESLSMRIKSVEKIIEANRMANVAKVLHINKALEKTFRYIIPFYYGIIGYQKKKNMLIMKNEANSDDALSPSVYSECETAFFESAVSCNARLNGKSLGYLIGEFRRFCNDMSHVNGKSGEGSKSGSLLRNVSGDGILLREAIGREYLCIMSTFDDIINFEDDYYKTGDKKHYSDIVSYINRVKHFKNGYDVMTDSSAQEFFVAVKKLLCFLIYNEDFQYEMLLGAQMSYDPIYPYVVRYTDRSENRDGYIINTFSIFVSEGEEEKEVKILSEYDYSINEKYYCIPNLASSNKRWWIEPILINCRKYDSVIHGDYKEGNDDKED